MVKRTAENDLQADPGRFKRKLEQYRYRGTINIDPEPANQMAQFVDVPYQRTKRIWNRPDPTTPITYGSVRKYSKVPNPNYNKYLAQAIGKGGRYKRTKYTRRYSRGGYRGRRFRGYGAYVMDSNDPLLTQWGGWAGSKLGEAAGGAANSLVKSFTGFGDYQVKANALMPGAAIENPNTHGGTVFRGTEYLGDIVTGTANSFKLQSFDINAALERTFPKLAQQLANYDQYVVEGMYFEFRSMSADALNSTNTALGQVIMSCNYNVLSPNFNSKQAMEEYDGGVSFKPSTSCKYFIECDRSQTPQDILYTRAGAVPTCSDQRLFDLGNFQIATNGFQGNDVNIGELWVSYQIAGLKPKLFSGFGNYNNGTWISDATYTNAIPLPWVTPSTRYSAPPAEITAVLGEDVIGWGCNGTTLQFPQSPLTQTYAVMMQWQGVTALSITHPTLTYLNCSEYTKWQAPENGATAAYVSENLIVVVEPNQVGTVALSSATLPPAGSCRIVAWQIPNLAVGL